ncbi:MAG: TetR/AcrR family transcriptional regulator [Candidatus Nanopelagicales bacterium]|jgi:AcrR family transcriptional regulator
MALADITTDGELSAKVIRLPKAQRREQLLDAARAVFVEQGYHAAGMDEIAERAGVSKPLLYQHFPSKLDLYLAILDDGIAELLVTSDLALTNITDNKMRVNATVRSYFEFVDDPNDAYRLVFESDLTNEPEVRERMAHLDREVIRRIAAVIKEDTGLSEGQAELLAAGMHGMSQVAATSWLRNPSISRDEAAELLSSLSWKGISGFPLSHPPENEAKEK